MTTFPSRKLEKPRIKEKDIQHYVRSHLELRGWFVIDTHDWIYRPAHVGITDLIAIKNGLHVWIECKRPSWKPGTATKTEQAETEFRDRVKRAGAIYALIKNFDEAEEDIKALDERAGRKEKP